MKKLTETNITFIVKDTRSWMPHFDTMTFSSTSSWKHDARFNIYHYVATKYFWKDQTTDLTTANFVKQFLKHRNIEIYISLDHINTL